PFYVHFRPMPGLFTLRTAPHGSTLSAPTAMFSLPDEALVALTEQIFQRSADAKRRLYSAMTTEAYQSLQVHIEQLSGVTDETRGAHHNLSVAFERVNGQFFASRMARPHIAWGRTFTGRKFGHYNFLRDSVVISRTLDDPGIPQFL